LAGDELVSWDQRFYDPIELPSGRKLITLRDAALYITKLPKAEHDAVEWLAAMEALLLVAEHDGPTMFARIGVMRALNRHKPKAAPAPRRKRAKIYRVVR
jgi:hypothetical protein